MNASEIIGNEMEKLYAESRLFCGGTIVLEKNSNSGLLQKVLPCNEQFLEELFNSVFWEVYREFGFCSVPFDCKYLFFLGNEMFFCKNTEERFLKRIGPEKKFGYSEGKITKITPISKENILFLLAAPIELARNAADVSVAAFRINQEMSAFEEQYENSVSFWKKNRVIDNAVSVSLQAMRGAKQSMRYSILASLSYSLGIKLRESFATKRNMLKELSLLALSAKEEELTDSAGYFSLSPYDISKPFLEENPFLSDFLKKMPIPAGQHYIVRENAKLCCSMHLSVLRKCFVKAAELKELSRDVFFLKPSELQLAFSEPHEAEKICLQRKKDFDENKKMVLPAKIAVQKNGFFFESEENEKEISGTSIGAKSIVEGRLVFAETSRDFGKVSDGDIIFSRNFSPELVVFYGKCIGILGLSGGALSHAAIVAREKGLPCIVQLKGSHLLKEGERIRADGNTGKISIL